MSSSSVRKETKFNKFMKGPVRILARARDFYVRFLTGCAGNAASFGGAVAGPNIHFSELPRNLIFSTNSNYSSRSDQDLRDLISVASTRSLTAKVEVELLRSRGSPAAALPRSRKVTVERIDEDKPCEFGVDDDAAYATFNK